MDPVSHRLASLLVGNSPELATVEMTVVGDTLLFPEETLIAWAGAELNGVVEYQGREVALPLQRPVLVRSGAKLRLGTAAAGGCRGYLAVAGGFGVEPVLESQSTSLRSGWGGWQGRTLRAGDQLPRDEESSLAQLIRRRLGACGEELIKSTPWFFRPLPVTDQSAVTLRVVRGRHFGRLDAGSQEMFFSEFQVTPQADRMGYRLSGTPLSFAVELPELKSGGTVRGTIQLPVGSDQPLLLMADGAPTGGYPELAHVIAADWAMAGQMAPGTPVRFTEVDLQEAHARLREQEQGLRLIADSVQRWANEGQQQSQDRKSNGNSR